MFLDSEDEELVDGDLEEREAAETRPGPGSSTQAAAGRKRNAPAAAGSSRSKQCRITNFFGDRQADQENENEDTPRRHQQSSVASGSGSSQNAPSAETSNSDGVSKEDMEKISQPNSVVWLFFTRTDKEKGKCNRCPFVKEMPTGTTTPLVRHLQKEHPSLYSEYLRLQGLKKKVSIGKAKNQAKTITDRPTILFPLDAKSKRAKQITAAIAMFMCKGLKPYSIVEELGFKYLLYILEPRYVIPSRTTFSRNIIPEMYQSLRRKLQLKLRDVKSELESVSITIDIWTSRAQDPFIAFTLQYVSPEFNMESYTLDLEPFSGHHTAEAICKKLDEKLEDIELNDDDIEKFVVSDNGSNMLAALEQPSEERRLDREIAEILRQRKSWEHLKCFNHTAQLAITDTKRDMNMNNVIDKTSRLVTRYKKSTTAKEALERYQKDLDLAPHSMLQRVKTRWNSDHIMLARAVEQKQAIINECAASGESCLSASEWRLAEGFVQVLQPIADHTDELGSQTVPTASMVLPVIFEIQAELQEFIQKAPKGTGIQFARKLLTNVENRFFYYNSKEVYKVAMVVDPRFKTLLEHESWFTTGKELLIDKADEKYLQRIQKGLVQTPQDTETVGDTPASAPEAGTKSSKWRHLVKKSVNRTSIASTSTERRNVIKDEVEAYLVLPTIDNDENPLDWWRSNKSTFPNLARVAMKYLGIAATETSSERVASVGSNICTNKRTRISPQHLQQTVFCHDNLEISFTTKPEK